MAGFEYTPIEKVSIQGHSELNERWVNVQDGWTKNVIRA